MEPKRDNPCCHCGANVHMPDEEWEGLQEFIAGLPPNSKLGGVAVCCDECLSKGLTPKDPTGLVPDLTIDVSDGEYAKGAARLLDAIFNRQRSPATEASDNAQMVELKGIRAEVSVGAYICPFCTAVHMKIDDKSEPEKCNRFAIRDEEWDELFKIVATLRRDRDKASKGKDH